MGALLIKNYPSPALRRREILRYMGSPCESGEVKELIDEMLSLCEGVFTPRVCYREFFISKDNDTLDLGFARVKSRDLAKNLDGCERIVLFCATVGHEIDRLIAKNSLLSPARALCLQSIGAEAIERVCDVFEAEIKEEYARCGYSLRPRFSAGYGDLRIEVQSDIFRALECGSKIGVTLNSSLLMSPTKSVSAIIGIKKI